MVVGKTNPTISMNEIFTRYSEADVLSTFLNIKEIPCLIQSPLREDRHPSFGIYIDKECHVRYIDYATNDKGGLLDLLMQYWNCTFRQALERVSKNLISKDSLTIKPKHIKTFTREEKDSMTTIEVAVRPWRDYDYEYWRSYGIEPKWLRYAEVYPISHKIVTKRYSPEDKGHRYVFAADKYAYVYCEHKENRLQLKVYQPYNKKGFKWCSRMDGSVISLWTKIPEFGNKVVICSSLKDSLCIACNLNIPTLALQGEGYDMSDTAIHELKRRYKQVFISFDGDKAGIKDSKKLSERTGFQVIPCPVIEKAKDWSDIYHYFGKERLIQEFTSAMDNTLNKQIN